MRVIYLSLKEGTPASGYWDQQFLQDILGDLPEGDRIPIVIPGAYQGDIIDQINEELSKYEKIMVFVTSDEEGKFDCLKLSHPDMIVYSQYGYGEKLFPLGYAPKTREYLQYMGIREKVLSFFFAGQITHNRRMFLQQALDGRTDGVFLGTEGFAQGMDKEKYIMNFNYTKMAPCPPGAVAHDSFRLYEALEAGAVPIADEFTSQGQGNFWNRLFPDAPFPILKSYDELDGILASWTPEMANKVFAWWIKKKWEIKNKLAEELGVKTKNALTVLVSTSPIPIHPDTCVIDKTIDSIRAHVQTDILIMIDGVRDEQKEYKEKYNEYIRQLLWKCNHEWKNVIPIFFDKHSHQSGMLKETLPLVETPLVMYVEHDTPLSTDQPIEWPLIGETLISGAANVIRFHYETKIPKEHEYLMLGSTEKFTHTKQWSQRPHIARTDFYKDIMQYFSSDSKCFIEDRIYTECVDGDPEKWRVYIYTPGENIKRSENLDGRANDRKFDKEGEQIW